MNRTKIGTFFKGVQSSLIKHSPSILTGIGVAGMITTTILAVKATPKAVRLLDKKKEEAGVDKLKPLDVVKTTWKCYIPAATTGATSIACVLGARSIDARRRAALATAYKLSETALSEYREKVIETVGEKKEREIRDRVDKDRIEKNPVGDNEVVIIANGDTLCYDYYSKRHFKSSIDRIKKAENEINRQLLLESYVSLNDVYYELGLSGTEYGDKLGWNTSNVKWVKIRYSAHLDDTETPCLAIDFEVEPKYNFDKLF